MRLFVPRRRLRFHFHRADAGAGVAPLATRVTSVFAIDDVRAGSIKRLAAEAEKGAALVAQVHGYPALLPV